MNAHACFTLFELPALTKSFYHQVSEGFARWPRQTCHGKHVLCRDQKQSVGQWGYKDKQQQNTKGGLSQTRLLCEPPSGLKTLISRGARFLKHRIKNLHRCRPNSLKLIWGSCIGTFCAPQLRGAFSICDYILDCIMLGTWISSLGE